MGDTFNLELPLLLADVGLNHGVLGHIGFKLTRHVRLDVAATEVQILINVVSTVLSMDLVGQISIAFHIIAAFLGIFFATLALFANNRFLELEAARKADLGQLEEHEGDALAISALQLVRVHVNLDVKVLQLDQHVLAGRHGVIILVPTSDLVLVHSEQPRDKRDEVDELLGGL